MSIIGSSKKFPCTISAFGNDRVQILPRIQCFEETVDTLRKFSHSCCGLITDEMTVLNITLRGLSGLALKFTRLSIVSSVVLGSKCYQNTVIIGDNDGSSPYCVTKVCHTPLTLLTPLIMRDYYLDKLTLPHVKET